MTELLIVRSKAKGYISSKKMRLGGDAIVALNTEVLRLLDRAIVRAKDAKAQTVKGRHI